MKLPYRNFMKKNKKFKLDKETKYILREEAKPNGFWYQFKDSGLVWGTLDWGKHIYELNIDISKIYTIKDEKDLIEFHNIYSRDNNYAIDWKAVSEFYSGFEIKNYINIREKIGNDEMYKKYPWFTTFDFSSGCLWDLEIVKKIKYFGKYINI